MTPERLSLYNFMCYRGKIPPLELGNMHIACLYGDNGNGKSAIVDAITWVLWGKSRARSDDDLIHLGEERMEVELTFMQGKNRYKVRRGRVKSKRGQTYLELQIQKGDRFIGVGGSTIAETQKAICDLLRMDYDTFVNSSLLRQGHADEFTIKPPGERKRILANILGLDFYDVLLEEVKERQREKEGEQIKLQGDLARMEEEIKHGPEYKRMLEVAKEERREVLDQEKQRSDALSLLQEEKRVYDLKMEEIVELSTRTECYEKELQELKEEKREREERVEDWKKIMGRKEEIEEEYRKLAELKKEEEKLTSQLLALDSLSQKRHALLQKVERVRGEMEAEARAWEERVKGLNSILQGRENLLKQKEALEEEKGGLKQKTGELLEKKEEEERTSPEIFRLEEKGTWLEAEAEELSQKRDLLLKSDAHCPLCGSFLSPEQRERIEEDYDQKIRKKREDLSLMEARLSDIRSRYSELLRHTSHTEQEIERAQEAMHKREISIALKVQEIEEAEVGLTEFQRRLMEIQSRINQGDILPSEQEEIKRLEEEIQLLAVDRERHDGVRKDIQAREGFTELKARLFEAQRNLEMESKRLPQIQESLLARERNINRDAQRLEALRSSLPDYSHLERKILEEERAFSDLSLERAERERKIGALEQKLHELSEMVKERGGVERNLSQVREERGIYQELSEAFGKKGIQAFIIESVLPQIEREANHILSRMTEGRMRLEILTQREVKKGGFMETLDINIIDDLGMRSYEMYSGGEAFRINFALRIALSKLLAQRAGAPLSLLIIDEGFGTQDRMGRTRIVEAIKSIEDEFDKIIVITHIEELMEAFPLRIEVQKERGISRISLS